MDELNGVVMQVLQVSPIMRVIRIAPVNWELPEFKAGQYCVIGLPASYPRCSEATDEYEKQEDNKLIRRAYSIASSSSAKQYLEFYITLVHSGSLTPRIFNLKIGDKVFVGSKFVGMFTLDEIASEQNIVLIGTGTGLAPYMSMLRSDALQREGKIVVIHGASNSWDLGYSSELNLLQSLASHFTYIPTITEPQKELIPWTGHTKFIQDLWEEGVIEKTWGFKPTADNTHIFLCGNPRMTQGMTECLENEGFTEHTRKTPGQIHVEKF